jgi:hypothetical protein
VEERIAFTMLMFRYSATASISSFVFKRIEADIDSRADIDN